ncbi:hypothetical protein LRS13_14430 [Svornostia abyssi]|uniref:Uncharacterized protein n=1 Tax=Svornostia abyssi TaxID=2898438 RepID=A0ABY5PB70_9ACTN|nr:hypothetical protein LRS13_14430 [Parviterribacteraceae bacterium J379]
MRRAYCSDGSLAGSPPRVRWASRRRVVIAVPHVLWVPKSYEPMLSVAATGFAAVASVGFSRPEKLRPWIGTSGDPTRSRYRPSQPVVPVGSSAPTSQ